MQKTTYDLIVFLVVVYILIIALLAFTFAVIYLYGKRQTALTKEIEQNRIDYESNLLDTKLEIQEQTFQNISREIHDNISLSLTLAKLNLNTLDWNRIDHVMEKVNSSVELITNSISDLSDISKGLNADIIVQNGLARAIEDEISLIRQTGIFTVNNTFSGNIVYMDNQKELIIFRIVQEALKNIIKHSSASIIDIWFHYNTQELIISIIDNGIGFDISEPIGTRKAGLKNMETRTKMLNGTMRIVSNKGVGTNLLFKIPISKNDIKS